MYISSVIKQNLTLIFIGITVLFASTLGMGALASAETAQEAVCRGIGSAYDSTNNKCKDPAGSGSVSKTVNSLVNVLSLFVGVAAVIMIIIGGLQYVMSGGDSGKVGNSKNTILYAVIGLVVVALAQVIVKFTVQSTK